MVRSVSSTSMKKKSRRRSTVVEVASGLGLSVMSDPELVFSSGLKSLLGPAHAISRRHTSDCQSADAAAALAEVKAAASRRRVSAFADLGGGGLGSGSLSERRRVPLAAPTLASAKTDADDDSDDDDDGGGGAPSPSYLMPALFAGVVASGILTNISLEKLNRADPGCGQVISLLQYLSVVAEQLPRAAGYLRAPAIPLRVHALFVVLMFLVAWMGNACMAYALPFALYLIIKSSNLVFSLLVGAAGLGKTYRRGQVSNFRSPAGRAGDGPFCRSHAAR